ncbi:hypothetical protein DACRYDRAFT_96645 [Dacryopinax primogenitus]|uniref:Phosphatidylinositol N-acetylglucosaminyltransferase subunit H conserved domain-containing protein n=1 Tax=Dacryopinax primogenitus (strain DJM 731) TaxID=1858805 RepID=M5G429_DACPD|nr:uncharacterized protein DACRYDRAFT_96645 [Dacryopinax primogenitus]EJT98512.1 hypothetical protein DACRYDRAFT_96645 [Dacryopinax primogenitus]
MARLRILHWCNNITEFEVLHRYYTLSLSSAAIICAFCCLIVLLFYVTASIWLRWTFVLSALLLLLRNINHPVSQSVLIIPPHGLQLTSRTAVGRHFDTFLPAHSISDILINEGFSRLSMRYYLAIIVDLQKSGRPVRIVTPLSDVKPTFQILQVIYHTVREALFNEYQRTERYE